jgi:hypothetical protein
MSTLYRLLTLDSKGKTAVVGVKAAELEQARAAAVAYITDKPVVVVTVISEHPL